MRKKFKQDARARSSRRDGLATEARWIRGMCAPCSRFHTDKYCSIDSICTAPFCGDVGRTCVCPVNVRSARQVVVGTLPDHRDFLQDIAWKKVEGRGNGKKIRFTEEKKS